MNDGGDEIGAASHRLREDDVRPALCAQFGNRGRQIVKAAAKARAGHFPHVKALGAQRVRIDQLGCLVVGDNAHLQPLFLIAAGQPGNGGCFPGAEKSPQQNKTDARHDDDLDFLLAR